MEGGEKKQRAFCSSSLLPLSPKLLKFNFFNIGRWDIFAGFDLTATNQNIHRTVGIHRSE